MIATQDEGDFVYAYFHGFRSSPDAQKGVFLRDTFAKEGIDFILPDLNRPSFERLSPRAMLAFVDTLDADYRDRKWRIVGSSLGGWLASQWAESNPDRVDRLVLLCPALDVAGLWPDLLQPGELETWERDGSLLTTDAAGREVHLHYAFFEEIRQQPGWPELRCPVTILHGTQDDVVPIEISQTWLERHQARAGASPARLVEVRDGHALVESLPTLERVVRETFFG